MHARKTASPWLSNRVRLTLSILFTLAGVGAVSRYALVTVVVDGLAAAIIVLPPMLAGLWLVPALRLGAMPLRWHLLLGSGFGLGGTSLLVLLLGLAGVMHRTTWILLLAVLAIAGILRLRTIVARFRGGPVDSDPPTAKTGAGSYRYLWLLAYPFLILALLAATSAPGFLWKEEGFGYDVLEYHLQLPKEYLQAGRIHYVPHNVYANLPANVEMLYLLAMIVHDDVYDIGVTANLIHLWFGCLTVFAAWGIGRDESPRAGIVCGVMTATLGWLPYLCGLAYVENGMLFYGMVALGLLLRFIRSRPARDTLKARNETKRDGNARGVVATAGGLAGFACGCKYTAFPMLAAPLALVSFLAPGMAFKRRITAAGLFVAAVLATGSPWLLKNQVMTGNPVFPLLNRVFGAHPPGWSAEETRSWALGHRAAPDQGTMGARLDLLWRHVLGDKYQRFGPAIFLLAVAGLFGRRTGRVDLILIIVVLVQLGVWLFATHLYSRFAVILLIPLVCLCGRAVVNAGGLIRQRIVVAAIVVGAAWNFVFSARLQGAESPDGAPAELIYKGKLAGYEYLGMVNYELPASAKVLLVGDAKAFYVQRPVDYCVVFNHNPFFELVRTAETDRDVLTWLRNRGYTHVLVNFSELRRLAATYGLMPPVDPQRLARLFDRLRRAGLRRESFAHPRSMQRYVELYELP